MRLKRPTRRVQIGLVVVLATALALLLAVAAWKQANEPPAQRKLDKAPDLPYKSGAIRSIDEQQITLALDNGREQRFPIDERYVVNFEKDISHIRQGHIPNHIPTRVYYKGSGKDARAVYWEDEPVPPEPERDPKALTAATFAKLQPGMTPDEVVAIAGDARFTGEDDVDGKSLNCWWWDAAGDPEHSLQACFGADGSLAVKRRVAPV